MADLILHKYSSTTGVTPAPADTSTRRHVALGDAATAGEDLAGERGVGDHGVETVERVLVDDEALKLARLALAQAVRTVLVSGLAVLGVSAPESM